MWRLGGDPTQNNIILHVQGLWEDPADDPINKDWLRENLSFSQLEARQRRYEACVGACVRLARLAKRDR